MPTLDLSDVLDEPEFYDDFSVIATTRVIGSNGEETDTAGSPVATTGIVIPQETSDLRLQDGQRVTSFIKIYTQYPLTAGYKTDDVNSRSSDTVIWHGRSYAVMATKDFSAFGSGFIVASCDLMTLAPPN